jgi:hypothetical protein
MLMRLLIDAPQVGVVGELVARFQERAEWCSHLETSGSEVSDLVLRPVDGRAHLVARLEEAVGRLWAMRDEHEPFGVRPPGFTPRCWEDLMRRLP